MTNERPRLDRIVLAGPAQCGKSTVAAQLEKRLNWRKLEISEPVIRGFCATYGVDPYLDPKVLEYCAQARQEPSLSAVRSVYREEVSCYSNRMMAQDPNIWIRPLVEDHRQVILAGARRWPDFDYPISQSVSQGGATAFIVVEVSDETHRKLVNDPEKYAQICSSEMEQESRSIPWGGGYCSRGIRIPGYTIYNSGKGFDLLEAETDAVWKAIEESFTIPEAPVSAAITDQRTDSFSYALH